MAADTTRLEFANNRGTVPFAALKSYGARSSLCLIHFVFSGLPDWTAFVRRF